MKSVFGRFKEIRSLSIVSESSRLYAAILGISVSLLFTQAAQAGAWVPEKDKGYAKFGVQDYSADDFFGTNDEFEEFNGTNLSFYGEEGLGKGFAVYGSILYSDIEQISTDGSSTSSEGFGDFEIGVRKNIVSDPFVLSASFLAKLPYLYDEDDELPRGNGQEDFEGRVLFGKSLFPYGYIGLEGAYRLRLEDPSDEIRYLVEYGVSFTESFYFRTKLDGIEAVGNADIDFDALLAGNLSLGPQFDLATLELTVGWNFDLDGGNNGTWGLELTYSDNLFGQDIIQGQGIQLGITRSY